MAVLDETGLQHLIGKIKGELDNKVNKDTLASDKQAGLIKLGYTEQGRKYPVKTDGSNKAYVEVPWTTSWDDLKDTSNYVKMTSAERTKLNNIVENPNAISKVPMGWHITSVDEKSYGKLHFLATMLLNNDNEYKCLDDSPDMNNIEEFYGYGTYEGQFITSFATGGSWNEVTINGKLVQINITPVYVFTSKS